MSRYRLLPESAFHQPSLLLTHLGLPGTKSNNAGSLLYGRRYRITSVAEQIGGTRLIGQNGFGGLGRFTRLFLCTYTAA